MGYVILLTGIALSAGIGLFLSKKNFGENFSLWSLWGTVTILWLPVYLTSILLPPCCISRISVSFEIFYTIISSLNIAILITIILSLGFLFSSVLRFLQHRPWLGHYDIGFASFASIMLFWTAINMIASNLALTDPNPSYISVQEYVDRVTEQFIYSLYLIVPIFSIIFLFLSSNSFTINHWLRRGIAFGILIVFWWVFTP